MGDMADQWEAPDTEPGAGAEPNSTDAEFTVEDVADRNLPVLATDRYHVGVTGTVQPFSPQAIAVLTEPVNPMDVEIRPDGQVYLPGIFYQEILDKAFGQGAWVLVRLDDGYNPEDNMVFYRGALFVDGRFVTESVGENEYNPANLKKGMTRARSLESARTECLKRCCKHLGISSDLWKPRWIREWKAQNAVQVWCINKGTRGEDSGKKKPLWRRKDAPALDMFPWKEEPQGYGQQDGGAHQEYQQDHEPAQEAPRQQQSRPPAQRPAQAPNAQQGQPQGQQGQQQGQAQKPAQQGGPTRPWSPVQLGAMFQQKVQRLVGERPEFAAPAGDDDTDAVIMSDLFPIFQAVELCPLFLDYAFRCRGNVNKLKAGEYDASQPYTLAQLEVAHQWANSQDLTSTNTEAQGFIQMAITAGLYGQAQVASITEKVQQEMEGPAGN